MTAGSYFLIGVNSGKITKADIDVFKTEKKKKNIHLYDIQTIISFSKRRQ